ncbi:MAG TPA: Uma2 family endonuclease [Candidatus Riflebacteria bacterium]|jgi:Uma2 family endonuclease|nr:Uma2 family endonuclease [Candidatus Riflebacteria bacterium]
MAGAARKRTEKKLSYADYLKWGSEERWELIEGQTYAMSPAPLPIHQEILAELVTEFNLYFRNKPCKVYPAPFDVRLAKLGTRNDDVFTVVQPDISIVCDSEKIDDRGCIGAPDLIIEILSPATASRDHILKKAIYEKNGVREYWLVDPIHRIVSVYRIGAKNKYGAALVFDDQATVAIPIFDDLQIDLARIFPPLPVVVCENPPPPYRPAR